MKKIFYCFYLTNNSNIIINRIIYIHYSKLISIYIFEIKLSLYNYPF